MCSSDLKAHELLSLGGQAAAAAHSLGTPLSTIKIITQDLVKQFKGKKDIEKDIVHINKEVKKLKQKIYEDFHLMSKHDKENYKAE